MGNCGGPNSNSIAVPTVEIKAAFIVWQPLGDYSFSCESDKDLYYYGVTSNNLLFLKINTNAVKLISFQK